MTITVVIPAHNESEYIAVLLLSLHQQTRLPDEVVVVCDCCSDDTAERAQRAFAYFPSTTRCLTVDASVGDIAGARNAGIRATTGDIVVCVDADTQLHPEVLRKAEQAVSRGVVLGGFWMVRDDRFRRDLLQSLLNLLWVGGINFCAVTLHNFVGTGCFFRRDINLLYNEAWGWGEDIEFCCRVKRLAKGKTHCILNTPLVYCDRRFIERGYCREIFRRLGKGIDHLRRSAKTRYENYA